MNRWIYVDVRDTAHGDDPLVSCHHVVLEAEGSESAYMLGFDLMKKELAESQVQNVRDHGAGEFLNDYVIDLGELPRDVTVMLSGYHSEGGLNSTMVERVYLHRSRAELDMQLFRDDFGKARLLREGRLIVGDDK